MLCSVPFCGCFSDCPSCLLSWLAPCVQFGYNAEAASGESCLLCCLVYCVSLHFGLCCIPHAFVRRDIRMKQGLPDEPLPDVCITCLCPCLSLSQEARQVGAMPMQGGPSQQVMS